MTFALEQLKRLAQDLIPLIVLAGNHSTPRTIYTSPILKAFGTFENVFPIFNQRYEFFDFGNIVFHGLPHINDNSILELEIEKIRPVEDKLNILLLHTSIGKWYLMEQYGEQIFPEEKIGLLKKFDYVALGHWHNFQQVNKLENAYYSGSTERMSESEINSDKGFCLVEFIDKTFIKPIFEKIPSRNWFKIEFDKCFEKTIEEIITEIQNFKNNNDISNSLIHLYFNDIKTEQVIELSNKKLKELLDNIVHLNVKRKTYQEKQNLIVSGRLDKIDELFAGYIKSKFPNNELLSNELILRAQSYFHKFETDEL
jgi:DNA repair exonuclease SbcCD nuclease subunit